MKERCKLSSLHEKFNQAFILWQQAYNNYFEPDIFITNLNATIQALRNITFTLQNKKDLFNDFDKWYQPWVERLKADEYMKWLNDSRIKIVHQDDFEINSFAFIRIFNYSTTYLADYKIPIEMPLQAIVGMLLCNNKISPYQIKAENILEVTRRWSCNEHIKDDILYILLCTFPIFSNMIADAHKELGLPIQDCEFYVKENNSHFSQKLIDLIENYPNKQIRQYSLKDLSELDTVMYSPKVCLSEGEKALQRYDQAQCIFEKKHDSQVLKIIDLAKHILSKDGYHSPMAFMTNKSGKIQMIALSFDTKADKYMTFAELARKAKKENIVRATIIAESYIIPYEEQKQFFDEFDVNIITGKKECLNIYEISDVTTTYLIPFSRKEDKTIVFEETEVVNDIQVSFAEELIKAIKENLR